MKVNKGMTFRELYTNLYTRKMKNKQDNSKIFFGAFYIIIYGLLSEGHIQLFLLNFSSFIYDYFLVAERNSLT